MSKYKFGSSSGFVEFYEEETKTNHILSGKAVVDKLNDLEAKLALWDEVIKEREDDIETLHLMRENLEQQLAEKEEENLKLREKYIGLINMNVQEFNKLEKEIEKHNQDKISFCIEQLEKVKEK